MYSSGWRNMLIIAWFLLISRMSYDCRYILWHMQGSAFLFACLTCSCHLFCLTEDGQTRSVVPWTKTYWDQLGYYDTTRQPTALHHAAARLRWEIWPKAPLQGNDFWSWNANSKKKHSTHLRSQNALFRLSSSVHLFSAYSITFFRVVFLFGCFTSRPWHHQIAPSSLRQLQKLLKLLGWSKDQLIDFPCSSLPLFL